MELGCIVILAADNMREIWTEIKMLLLKINLINYREHIINIIN